MRVSRPRSEARSKLSHDQVLQERPRPLARLIFMTSATALSRQELIATISEACTHANGPKFLLTVDQPPVNLADILLALETSGGYDEVAILQDGRFAIRTDNGLDVLPSGCWDLRSNRLEEQSGETLELIARLLQR